MKKLILTLLTASLLVGAAQAQTAGNKPATEKQDNFEHLADRFADLQVLKYKIDGFETLTPKQKELCYYLYQAALSGRDMIWDQNYKHNLRVRKTLEAIISSYKGDKKSDQYQQFIVYANRVFFSNGIHHHYSSKKIIPNFNEQFLSTLIYGSNAKLLPLQPGESVKDFVGFITPIICDPNKDAKKINLAANEDLLLTSAMNFYENLSQAEVEEYYEKKIDKKDPTPISYGLNSKLVKENGEIKEKVWKVGGMYNNSIVKIVSWLEKAVTVAENENQKDALKKLITFYKTGSLKDFDAYNIAWVKDVDSRVDVVNGFIEVYGDPLGYRASYESVVSIKDMEASKRIEAIGSEAQYFEDNSPILPEHKKKEVTGISAKVITAVVEAGDAAPSTPIGINLPNANWIRKNHGSKSVQLSNIVSAYDAVGGGEILKEFCFTDDEIQRAILHGGLAGKLHTDMHEVIGHASGQILPGVGTPKETLKNYASALEEARANLVALYYMMDPKLVEMGVMPDLEVGMAEYDAYIRNGMLVQLSRLELGEQLEEA
ncbi:MAG: dipeptidyl-peptidase 3 family protein, partial [Flexibacteraceae bacterium]